MTLVNNVLVNLTICGIFESSRGVGSVSLSAVRNHTRHPWPQMDIGQIDFYNPENCQDEFAKNRRLTRKQALWLAKEITASINGLDVPEDTTLNNNGDVI